MSERTLNEPLTGGDKAAVREVVDNLTEGDGKWLDFESPHFAKNKGKWAFIAAHLAGNMLDADHRETFLVRKSQGEMDAVYDERAKIADPTPHYSRGVVSLSGILRVNESAATVEHGDILGDPADDTSVMHTLTENIDGDGNSLEVVMQGVGSKMIAYHELWGMVDGVDETGMPRLKVLPPFMIPRPIWDGTRLASVKVLGTATVGASQTEEPRVEKRWYVYHPGYYEVYTKGEKGETLRVQEPTFYGESGFQYRDTLGRPSPPFFRVCLPFDSFVGHTMALKANSLLNHESSLDFLMWLGGFPRMFADVLNGNGDFDKELWDEIKTTLRDGDPVIPGKDNRFGSVPLDGATAKLAHLQDKRRDFYATFFQAYADAAKEKTATEIRQDSRTGLEAFLGLLVAAKDEFENTATHFLEQAVDPRAEPGQRKITRSRDFQPVDLSERISMLIDRHAPGGRIPVDVETLTRLAMASLEEGGFGPKEDDEEAWEARIGQSIRETLAKEAQASSLAADFGI